MKSIVWSTRSSHAGGGVIAQESLKTFDTSHGSVQMRTSPESMMTEAWDMSEMRICRP